MIIKTTGTEARAVYGIRALKEHMEARSLGEVADLFCDRIAELSVDLDKKRELAVLVGVMLGKCKGNDNAVVRCGGCLYWDAEDCQCKDEMGYGRKWKAEDYCSYGVPRV